MLCTTVTGIPSDTTFTLTYVRSTSTLLGSEEIRGGYVFADLPTESALHAQHPLPVAH